MERTSARKTTVAASKVRGIVKGMYARAHLAKENGQPVAYCMGDGQYNEILHVMGVAQIFTENYAGLCATKRQAEPLLLRAEAEGYSNLICGYVRTGLGFDCVRSELGYIPEGMPDGGMAKPDLLLGASNTCDPRYKWYQALGRYLDVPTYCHDVVAAPIGVDPMAVEDHYVAYQLEQLRGLVAFLEAHTNRKLDLERLDDLFARSQEVFQLWYDCDQLRKAVPSPMPSEDHFNVFVPAHFCLGDDRTLDFYRELYAEVKERVDNGVGAIPNERYRLLWGGGLPPWHTMWIFNHFEAKGAVFAIERAYRNYDPVAIPKGITHPLEKLAYRTFHRLSQRYERAKSQLLLELIREYRIDGMVTHATKSCRACTIGQLFVKNQVQEQVDIPFLQLQSDLIDLRDYSEEQWRSSIDAFLEVVST